MKNVCKFFKSGFVYASAFAAMSLLAACSGDNVAGGASGDAGIIAVTDWEVAGVSQKGPFVTGSAVTVQELDGITLKQTGKSFKGTIKSDKGDFAIKDINLESQYAILEASGYYRDEISGKKSSSQVTLRALTDLKDRKHVNINLLTHLEYERVMYLVTEKKKSIAEAKEQAEKEVLATFGIEGDFAESEDLNIFETGDGNAALLAISVLLQSDVDVAGLTERMGEFSISLAEGGSWDDADVKTAIADWACDVDLKGSLSKVRKNVEDWKYADTVPAFEKYVTNFWWNNYGLGVCNEKRKNETKRNVNKLSKLYNEYFVCENGRWVIPGDEPKSSSDNASSSSGVSSSSVYNPYNSSSSRDSLSEFPSNLRFLEDFCYIRGPVVYGGGEQRVWTCTSWANVHDTATRDSALSALVDTLGAKGFVFEKTMLSDSLKSFYLHSFYDSLSYIYSAKNGDVVYKIAMTKTLSPAGLGYGAYMFDVVIFVMKDGFEDLPISMSSSAVSSSSVYNPFDTVPELPVEMAFLDSSYKRMSYASMGEGKQKVWFYSNKTKYSFVESQDSAASEFVKNIGRRGFSYEGTVRNDSARCDYYDDTSYVYVMEKGDVVYKLALTKGATPSISNYGFSIKAVVLKDGFKELSTKTSVLPDELFFVDKFLTKPIKPAEEYADGKQTVWRVEGPACGGGCDSFMNELVSDAKENGFVFSGTYSNDSLDNEYTGDSHVYSKTSDGKVYSVVFTKEETVVYNGLTPVPYHSYMYFIKLIVRDANIDEVPTEKKKDYDSPKYREIPEDLKFVVDSTQLMTRAFSNDPKWTVWVRSTLVNYDSTLFDEVLAVADDYAALVTSNGLTLKSKETLTMNELEKKLYNNNTSGWNFGVETTVYTFEKDVEKFRYEILVYAIIEGKSGNLGSRWVECRADIRATIYDK
ncbi:MAG: hypothetical protein IJM92_17445 [Fibrobacter sp.]|uniref:hypothetical protein n=1 Tax=Fibrobacter sp. TaxID=35828 RepID=UPI0025BC0505|nr:hypothetical protein [Fibrobacter sp.]MBQ7081403.1 hypothetical protein [Fibrobacter sp.]